MTVSYSICGEPIGPDELAKIGISNETIIKICGIVRERLENHTNT